MTARRRTAASRAKRVQSAEPDLFADPTTGAAPYDRPHHEEFEGAEEQPPALTSTLIPGESPASAVPVTTLTRIAKDVLEGAFMPLWIRGEVSDFKKHRNGHWYFCLRDESSQIRCVVWSRDQRRIPAAPDDGMQLTALGQLTVYTARGDMQLVITAMEAAGDGLWRKALEEARARLQRDGLLAPERKRRLPLLPRRVAVVTSPSGAALHDIISVIRRRAPSVEIVVVAAKVQGDGATDELVAAIERVDRWSEADAVIIGRGGGAREDLWAFNDERVARAVAACGTPTISAVGHEVDVTLCDLVADVRAATPSAAAEAAVPVLADLRAALVGLGDTLRAAIERRTAAEHVRLSNEGRMLHRVAAHAMERRRARLETISAQLHAMSPLAVLGRGYSVARDLDGATLQRVAQFRAGLAFDLVLRDGSVRATVDEVTPDAADRRPPRDPSA
ncbi:MAG TPA: exodeoxyribonuclease VII large subunit [Gemmatimonadaceae bacterium]|nr:exodeoxyribonuclease VII large subunit [Gemmatimonadaceae bacterium]